MKKEPPSKETKLLRRFFYLAGEIRVKLNELNQKLDHLIQKRALSRDSDSSLNDFMT